MEDNKACVILIIAVCVLVGYISFLIYLEDKNSNPYEKCLSACHSIYSDIYEFDCIKDCNKLMNCELSKYSIPVEGWWTYRYDKKQNLSHGLVIYYGDNQVGKDSDEETYLSYLSKDSIYLSEDEYGKCYISIMKFPDDARILNLNETIEYRKCVFSEGDKE